MKSDYYISLVLLFQMIAVVFQLLLPIFGIVDEERAATLRVLVTALTYAPAIWIVAKRNMSSIIIPFVVYVIFLLFSYVLFPESHEFIESNNVKTLTPIAILSVIFFYNINDFEAFKKALLLISRISPVVGLLFVWGTRNSPFLSEEFTYSMSFGYSFLLPTVYLVSQKNNIDRLLGLLLFLMVLVDGSRGPAVVIVLYYAYYIMFVSESKSRWKSIAILVVVAGLAVTYLAGTQYVENSRTISLMTSGETVSHDSGRDAIQDKVKVKIEERPLFGWGVGADRHFMGTYSHNIFLEVTLHYGYIGSFILFSLLFVSCARIFFSQKWAETQGGRGFFAMMFLFGFVPMLVSGSYLITFNFSLLIGYLIRFARTYKAKKVQVVSPAVRRLGYRS